MRCIFKTQRLTSHNKKNTLFFIVMISVFLTPTLAYSNQCCGQINPAGPYIGGYLGSAWGSSNFNTDAGALTSTSYFVSADNIISVNQSGSPFLHTNAFVGGIQIGNNWTCQNFVYGLALDFGSFHLSDAHYVNDVPYPTSPTLAYSLQTAVEANWLFTARGRLGITPNCTWPLVYATGGLALTKLEVSNAFSDTDGPSGHGATGGASHNHFKTGWTAGGGLEFPLTAIKDLTVNMEYLYVNFGSVSTRGSIGFSGNAVNVNPFSTSADLTANIFRVGLNYKF